MLTAKQERFARAYIETGNASEAYRRSYNVRPTTKPETAHQQASRLLSDPHVTARVTELQALAAERSILTRAWVLERLMRNADKGVELDDLGASNKALELLGKTDELRMFIDRSDVTNTTTLKADGLPALAAFISAATGGGEETPPPPALPD